MSASVSSLFASTQTAPPNSDVVSSSTRSLIDHISKAASSHSTKKSKTQVSSLLNDIESFAESDVFSSCEALRREDGSLRIFITGNDWDKGTLAEQLNDQSSEDEVVISASRKHDQANNPFIFIEVKRFLNIDNDLYEDDVDSPSTKPVDDLCEKNTISISSSGKVKTSFPADRKFEVLNGIDALKSTVRRLHELELYKDRGVLENDKDAEEILRKLHVYDNFDPGKNSENVDESNFKDMEHQLSDINKILQMVE